MLFSEYKAKAKSRITEISYNDLLASYITGMFEYDDLPVEPEYERVCMFECLADGKCALYWSDHYDRWIFGSVYFTGGELNEYGDLPDAICIDKAGHEQKFKDWMHNEKCFVIFNNRNHTPDFNIMRYADLMAKIDISLNANIVNSRMSPIVVCRDDNTRKQMEQIISANHEGQTEVITSPNILNEAGDNVTVVNITDVNASDKIQYLSHAKDDILRSFLNIYGIHITGTGKMAQQSIEEINGTNNMALVIPYEMLKARQDTLDRFNAVTGYNVKIRFSKCWEREERETDAQTEQLEANVEQTEAAAEAAESAPEESTAPENGDVQPADEKQEQGEQVND